MLDSPAGLAATKADPVDEPTRPPSVEVSSTDVLITEQGLLFSSAAAVGVHRGNIGGRLVAIVRRILATSTDASLQRPRYEPRRYGYLEDARMAREVDRL